MVCGRTGARQSATWPGSGWRRLGRQPSLRASHTTRLRMSVPNGRPRAARAGGQCPARTVVEQPEASRPPSALRRIARTRKSKPSGR